MRRMVLLVPLVLGLATAVWLLGSSRQTPDVAPPDVARQAPAATPDADLGLPAPAELAGTARPEDLPREPTWPVVPPDQIPRGDLEVLPLGPDGEPLPVRKLQVRLTRPGAPFWGEPLGIPDPETRAWRFRAVPFGKVLVHVWGDHVLHTRAEAEVPRDGLGRVEVRCELGGAIAYRARLTESGEPETVTVRLRSSQSKHFVSVHMQTRRRDDWTPDERTTQATLGAEGVLFAVPPGEYTLEATSAEGAKERYLVTVRAGETTELELVFRY